MNPYVYQDLWTMKEYKNLCLGESPLKKWFGAIIRKGRSMQFPNHSFNRFMLLSQTIVFLIDRLFFII